MFGADQRKVLNGLQRNFLEYSSLLSNKTSIELNFEACRIRGIDPLLVTQTDTKGNQFCFGFRIEYLSSNQVKISSP